jgi:hypothetical protein
MATAESNSVMKKLPLREVKKMLSAPVDPAVTGEAVRKLYLFFQ